MRREPADQSFRLAQNLCFTDNPPLRVDDADAGEFQGHIDAGILLHGRSSMMLAQALGLTPMASDTTIVRDDHPASSDRVRARPLHHLKHFRSVATRYDKRADNYLAGVKLASLRIWM